MKKTIKISLQGAIFFMDEDAFASLSQYLDDIGNRLGTQEGREEIIQDIETRIAEIFTERLGGKREVVTQEDVTAVISLLGRPEDIAGEEGDTSSAGPGASRDSAGTRKRLFRDPENSVLGGVCGGLGAYFNLDPVWFRVAFIVLTLLYGASILVYLLMWLIVPEARTTVQRLEMTGQPVNLSNLSKNISREYEKVKTNIKNIPESDGYRRSRNALQEFMHVLGEIILVTLKILGIIIGAAFVLTGLIILVSLSGIFFFHFSQFFPDLDITPYYYLPDVLGIFTRPENIPYILGSLILTLGIPLAALIYAGVKLIFNIRTRNRVAGVTVFVIWLISAVSLAFFVADIASGYSRSARITETAPLKTAPDTLFVTSATYSPINAEEILSADDLSIFRLSGLNVLLCRPSLEIVRTSGPAPELEISRKARGNTRSAAVSHAEKIAAIWESEGKTLSLAPWCQSGTRWYAQEVRYTLRVPEGTVICLDKSLRHLLEYVPNDKHRPGYDLAGKCWVMGEEGLEGE